jgi:MFS family permease
MCALWGAISGSFNIQQICIPLITRDISPDGAAQWLGIFMSTNAVCGAIFSVAGGFFSDFVGRMALMQPWTLYFFLSVLAVLTADYVSNVYFLLFARTAALSIPTTILLAYLSDFLRDAALVESYAYLSGSFGVVNLTATLLCGVLNEMFSRTASLLLALSLSGMALYIVMRSPAPPSVREAMATRAEETRQRGKKEAVSREEFYRAIRLIVADRYLLLICIACSTVRMANMNDHLMLVYFVSFRANAGLSSISYVLGLMAFTMSVSQLVALPLAVRRRCVYPALLASLLVMSGCVMSMSLCFNLRQFAVTAFFLGCSLIAPSVFNARISALTSATGISGVTLGVVSTLTNTAEVVVAVLYGNLLGWATQAFGASSMWSGIPFMINGLTVFLALLLVLFAEWRYGRKFGPWGSEDKRQAESLAETAEDDVAEVEEPKLGGLAAKDVESFATNIAGQRPTSSSYMNATVVPLHLEKSDGEQH